MTISKATENSVTSFLKEELKSHGVKALPFASLDTPAGRREVDLLCENSGIYTIEAKFMEKDFVEAISKIQNDYFKYHKELGIKGGFAILYPNELSTPVPFNVLEDLLKTLQFKVVIMFLPTDARKNFTVFEGTLTEVAQELSTHILTPPEYVEPNIEWIIKSLRAAASYITEGLKHLAGVQLENIFGGKHVFRNILQYEKEEKYPTGELRMASAYLLLNQILFYHVLSRKAEFPEIDTDSLSTPLELQHYFELVLNKNYRAIFSYDMTSKISKEYTDTLKKIINAIKGISPEKIGGDLLGTIFHDLIPLDVRKYIAAFYTNVHAADLLACLSIDTHSAHIADFAVGSGGLLVAAYRRKKRILENFSNFGEKDHNDFIDQLLGVDVMPFAASTAACHLALQSPEYYTDNTKIAIWDSTELQPGLKIPSIADIQHVLRGQTSLDMFFGDMDNAKGVVKLGEKEPEQVLLSRYDVVMMNPPFTRQERVPTDYKETLLDRFKEYEMYIHGQLGYYGYFILLADKFLRTGGRLAVVLPATVLRVRSSQGIRQLLSEMYHTEYIVTGKKRLNFSESTWKREILLIAKKLDTNEKKGKTTMCALEKLPRTISDIERVCRKIQNVDGSYTDHEISAFTVNSKTLEEDLDWYRFIMSFETTSISDSWEIIADSTDKIKKFGNVYNLKDTMREGIESRRGMKVHAVFIPYNTERAIRRDDAWILKKIEDTHLHVFNRYLESTLQVPKDCIVPGLRTISNNVYFDISGNTDFVIINDFPESENFFYGDRSNLRDVIPKWKHYVENRLGNLVILRRFVINAPGTIHLCYYASKPITAPGTAWICDFNDEDAKILCLWFNSSINLAQVFNKRIEDIWVDIHKYILREFYILNPEELSREEKDRLIDLFNKFKNHEFPSLSEQYTTIPELKKEIDAEILSILGFQDAEIDRILTDLYDALKTAYKTLQKMS
ncbi:MAG: N-6 DNA methylase [Candidatus Methanofastidiosia archaeon]